MEVFNLAISYVWEYDKDFIDLIEEIMHRSGITTFIIGEHNIIEVTEKVRGRKISFNFYLDRASDVDSDFAELAKILTRRKCKIFNPYKNIEHATDKANMHLEFITAGLNVPHSIIIPPHSEREDIFISVEDLAILGRPFIIKPCNTTGGGVGVVTGAETLKEILEERLTNTEDKYLLQEKIYPAFVDGKRTWFRSFWSFGRTIPTWWDDTTHIYSEFTAEDLTKKNLKKLIKHTKKIADMTNLDFFSTEIVLTGDDKFVVIDYVNDQCDMRLQSKHMDGVPDDVVKKIIMSMKNLILKYKRGAN